MPTRILFVAIAATILGLSASFAAGILDPIPTTGHDQDVVFEAGLTSGQTGASGELGSRQFFEAGVFADGLPRTVEGFVNSITGNTINFAFEPFEANNILKFDVNAPQKTLTLVTPAAYSQLAVVHTGGSLGIPSEVALLQVTINYVGGITQTGIVNVVDWGAAPTLPAGTTRFLTADRTTADARTWPINTDNNTTANRWAIYLSEITPDRPDLEIVSITFGPISLFNGTTTASLNSGDDVVVFGLSGTPGNVVVVAPEITDQPQSQTVVQGQPVSFTVGVTGSPLSFQWYKDTLPISGANQATYAIPSAALSDAGAYSVVITNTAGSAISVDATLTVLPDVTGPVLIRAVGNASGDMVTLTFSEALNPTTAGEVLSYQIFAAGSGEELFADTATLINGTNVVIVNNSENLRVTGRNYTVVVVGLEDFYGNPLDPNPTSIVIRPDVLLIGFDVENEWKYEISGADLTGTGWQDFNSDDSFWSSGPSGLGLDISANEVPIRTELPYTAANITTYFRKRFTLPSGTNDVILRLRDVVEDGAVYYLNGQEVFRNRMPAGPVNYATLASPSAPEPALIAGPFLLSTTNLFPGENVLAVEVHQSGTASSDLELAVELIANIPAFAPPLPRMHIVRHNDGTITLTWNANGFCIEEQDAITQDNSNWTASAIISGVPFTPSGGSKFYRLRSPCN